jgi:uncharacterized membrane protein YeaQ/YmgE (transglycosylase-associated protein family)
MEETSDSKQTNKYKKYFNVVLSTLKYLVGLFIDTVRFLCFTLIFVAPGVIAAVVTNYLLVRFLGIDFGDFKEILLGIVGLIVSSWIFEETEHGKDVTRRFFPEWGSFD